MEDVGLPAQKIGVAEYIFGGIFATLMETVHIELADEGVDVPVPEVLGKDVFLELLD